MKKINKSLLALSLMSLSASSFAYSVKTLNCYTPEQMSKKKAKRVSSISLISAKIGKKYEFALYNPSSKVINEIQFDSGVYELSQDTPSDYSSFLADKSSTISIKTNADKYYSIRELELSIAKENQNAGFVKTLRCLPNTGANKMGPKYLKSYAKYFKVKNNNFKSIVDDTLLLADIYEDTKAQADLKKGQYLSLRDNPYKLVTTKATVLDDGEIILNDEDSSLVACREKASQRKAYSGGKNGTYTQPVECLKPRFKVKKRSTRKKIKWNFRFKQSTSPILQCEPGSKRSRKVIKPKKSKFHKRRYPRRSTGGSRPSKTSRPSKSSKA